MMQFYSTNNKSQKISLREAVLKGLAPDNGLYMPERIPQLPKSFFKNIDGKSFREIGFDVADALIGEDLPSSELKRIVDHTISFDTPLAHVEDDVFALELFHGPTLAFKDFGARFLAGLFGYFASQQEREITLLVATSGDTGSAVANGFLNVEGTRVIVLYPSGKVSEIQEKQFTTLGANITALEVAGTFDDCQRLVKQAFLDDELRNQLFLTSANSINIGRLIPQMFYYFEAYARLKDKSKRVVFSVPSGNFGNLTAGLIASRMGLPVNQFIASTNANNVVPEYLQSGVFKSRTSTPTISNAMDVGNPSNFVRMLELSGDQLSAMRKEMTGYYFSDDETRQAMREVFARNQYILDPHGAVGYLGVMKFLQDNPGHTGIFLETAHPGKFKDVVESTLDISLKLPERLADFFSRDKKSVSLNNDFASLKSFLMSLPK